MKNLSGKNPTPQPKKIFWALVGVIILAGIFFRFWNLGSDELTFDEGIYAFRSIGYLDYMENPAQVTPIQMFVGRTAPAWLSLSFHDAPPLFFMIGHVFFNIFGESVLVARLPSALAGLGIIVLMFFITRLLFEKFEDEKFRERKNWAGLLAGGITAISFASVAISRLDQLESVLFFLILLNIYIFLRLTEDTKWWWLFGVSFGLAMLVKYTCVFLIPVYFIYLLFISSPLLKNWRWYAGWGIVAFLFLPVIIYNINLYGLLGHFDLQFAYLFGQATPEWQGIGGKNQEPFSNVLSNVGLIYSLPFLIVALVGFVVSNATKTLGKIRWFMVLNLIFILVLLTKIGSAVRFISFLIIPAIFFITLGILWVGKYFKKPALAVVLAVLFLGHESYFTTNMVFTNRADYGIVKLDNYFDSTFGNARPAGLLQHPNPNLNKVIKDYAENRPATLPQVGIVYDDQISTPARLWLFSRRQYYHGLPVMPASAFLDTIKTSGGQSLKGFEIYFVKAGPATTISEIKNPEYLKSLNDFFAKLPAQSKFTIKNSTGVTAFEVSK
ncbi:MAG: glycosyltransferase family 39 protein, partial [bacterium]|nr:glycosyltransferase family 39 protein [bacterium]